MSAGTRRSRLMQAWSHDAIRYAEVEYPVPVHSAIGVGGDRLGEALGERAPGRLGVGDARRSAPSTRTRPRSARRRPSRSSRRRRRHPSRRPAARARAPRRPPRGSRPAPRRRAPPRARSRGCGPGRRDRSGRRRRRRSPSRQARRPGRRRRCRGSRRSPARASSRTKRERRGRARRGRSPAAPARARRAASPARMPRARARTGRRARSRRRRRARARRALPRIGQLADQADDRRRVDRARVGLVVERDVAADDRHAERLAGVGEALDGPVELPRDGGLLRVAEVEAVGQAERLGADAGQVLRALEHRLDRADVRVAGDAAAVAVDRGRDRVAGLGKLEDGGVGASGRRTVREPTIESYCSNAHFFEAIEGEARSASRTSRAGSSRLERRARCRRSSRSGSAGLEVVERAAVDERLDRHLAGRPRRRGGRGRGPSRSTSPTTAGAACHLRQIASTSSTLAGSTTASIRSCDSETMISNGSMSASRSGTRATSMSIPTPPPDAISAADEVRPAAPRSWSETRSPAPRSSRQHSTSFDSSNGSPIWTDGPLRLVGLVELGRGEDRGAADPVAAGRGAHQDDLVADPRRGRADHRVGPREADAHRVHQAVLLVGGLEVDLAADGRNADRVAVVADAGDDVVEEVARALRGELAEAKRVEDRDRPRAQREDVAQDPADAGGGALERLDRRRVVVRLDLEGDRVAVADVDRAGVLARAHHDARALGRQAAEQLSRVLVGAVLGPKQREHRQLDVVGLAPELLVDQLELGVGQPELAVLRRGRCGFSAHEATTLLTPLAAREEAAVALDRSENGLGLGSLTPVCQVSISRRGATAERDPAP